MNDNMEAGGDINAGDGGGYREGTKEGYEAFVAVRNQSLNEQDLVYRLRKRAEIRRQIPGRKSVVEGAADRIADLLEEAAAEIERLRKNISAFDDDYK
jgi:hypothetical protein